ncbi:hypothetical protein J7K42_02060 [bacterium]|nr:hypothetical protein [bacterium]
MPTRKLNSINDLILFSLYSSSEGKCSFEKLVKESFNRFPKVFALKGYPQWPDARKLDRPLRTLRKRKLIKGDPKISFSLTLQGKKIAQEIARNLAQKKLL